MLRRSSGPGRRNRPPRSPPPPTRARRGAPRAASRSHTSLRALPSRREQHLAAGRGAPRGRGRPAPGERGAPSPRLRSEGGRGKRRHRAGKAAPPPRGSGPDRPPRARRRPPQRPGTAAFRAPAAGGRTALPAAWPPREDGESGRGTGSRPAASEHGGPRRPRPLAHPAGPAPPRHEAAAPPCPPPAAPHRGEGDVR
ncbi:uncharacterized protein LOC116233941 [Phasianus colchicus]|uniref:uncharacterized protein LOC116233941 n=1 Tax=Phasianus colchicus TaxID=9054 RepID=UPI00129D9C50|nr:uncharacterized protein LOC116233941 [Phasianus colchicus]